MKVLRNRLFIGSLCIIMAILIGFVAVPMMISITNQKVDVVRARTDIAKSELITSEMVEVTQMFSSDIPAGAAREPGEVVGRYALTSISKNDLLFESKYGEEFPYDDASLYNLPKNRFAVTISTSSLPSSVGGKVMPGDVVTVMVNQERGEMTTDLRAELHAELMYMKVLAVTDNSGVDIESSDGALLGEDSLIPYTVTLLCNQDQARMLAGFEAHASIHLALVARDGTANAQEYLDEQENHFRREAEKAAQAQAEWEEEEAERLRLEQEERERELLAQQEEEEDEEEEDETPVTPYVYRPPAPPPEPEPEPEPEPSEPARPPSIFDGLR